MRFYVSLHFQSLKAIKNGGASVRRRNSELIRVSLAEKGYRCDVVAPTSIPAPRSKQIKTDRIDAAQLAQFYAKGLLTFVSVPELEQEQDRDLMRSHQNLVQQQTELRKHMQALLRRNGLYYKAQTQNGIPGTVYLFISVSISRRNRYTVPRFPPASAWDKVSRRRAYSRRSCVCLTLAAIHLVGSYFA